MSVPAGVSPGSVSMVGIHVPADDEAGPAQPGHRGGSERQLVPFRHTRRHPQTHSQPQQPTAGQRITFSCSTFQDIRYSSPQVCLGIL